MAVLEKERQELETKLAGVVQELTELRAQIGRVENSELALKKESENALTFYEDNLIYESTTTGTGGVNNTTARVLNKKTRD